jgi:type VI secretion system protein ImpH
MLSDRFALPVTGEQFVGGWHRIENDELTGLGSLGRAPVLGQSATLGRKVWDQGAGIRLSSKEMNISRIQSLLPGGADHAGFCASVRRFLPANTKVEVALTPAASALPPARLSARTPLQLGWTAWLAGPAASGKSRCVTPSRFRFEASGA